jgi:hypothetical protein
MQRWEHTPDWQPKPGAGWYRYWYQCTNAKCSIQQVMPIEAKVEPEAIPVPVGMLKPRKHDRVAATYGKNRDGVHETRDGREMNLKCMELLHLYQLRSKLRFWAKDASERGDLEKADNLWREVRAIGRELGRRGIAPKAKRLPHEAEGERLAQEDQAEIAEHGDVYTSACGHCGADTSYVLPECENCGEVLRPDLVISQGKE